VTLSDLEILLSEGEGTLLEYKESLSASFAREIVALANTLGGKVLLGVRDDGTVAGIRNSNDLRARIQDIARNCDPPVHVRVDPLGNVVVVTVRESDAKPVQCSDGFFWRQGAVTQKLSRDEIRDFFRSEGAVRFDLAPCARFRYPKDFDLTKFDAWLRKSRITAKAPVADILVNMDAAERTGGKLLFRNAGVLFFARDVRRLFTQAYITCLLFKGRDRVHILDRKDFAGGVVADIEESLRFIERNTRTAYRIERLQRDEIAEYPMAALREAVTNAVMHRDWFNEGANVFVEIYEDRIEVSNPGGLPKGMRPSDLGRKSVRRNPLIADMLHRIAFIEKAGTGIRRMRDAARERGCPAPIFEEGAFFTATFFPKPEVRARAAAQGSGPGTTQVPPKHPSSTPQVTSQVRAVLVRARRAASRDELQQSAGIVDRKHFRASYVEPLLGSGWLEMTIPDKPRSPKQRYRTTSLGLEALAKSREER
jgi:ATP-dependent DNA helicase RecG